MYSEFYIVRNNVLFKHIVDNGHKFEPRVILNSLVDVVLNLGHNQSGHNGYQRTYEQSSACTIGREYRQNSTILQMLQVLCTPKGTENSI